MENIYFILFLLFITKCSFSQIKNVDTVYLDKNDPIFISIKGRAVSDLKQIANPESPGNKLIAAHLSTWSEEKLKQFEAIFVNAINDYNAKTHFEPGTFFSKQQNFNLFNKEKFYEANDFCFITD